MTTKTVLNTVVNPDGSTTVTYSDGTIVTTPISVPAAPTATNPFKAVIRGAMPFVESNIVAIALYLGVHITLQAAGVIAALGGLGLTAVLHAAEATWPKVGIFLGWLGAPSYTPAPTKAQLQAQLLALTALIAQGKAVVEEKATPSQPTSSVGAGPPPAPVVQGAGGPAAPAPAPGATLT
jgi:hypothetical protein